MGRNFRCKFQWLHNFGEGEKFHCHKNSIATRPQVSQNYLTWSLHVCQKTWDKIRHGKKHEPKDWHVFLGESQVFFSSKMWTNLYPKWSGEIILFDQHLIFQKLCCCNGTAQVSHYKTWHPQTLYHFSTEMQAGQNNHWLQPPPKKKPKRSIITMFLLVGFFLSKTAMR